MGTFALKGSQILYIIHIAYNISSIAVPWRSSSLTDVTLADITDGDPLTGLTLYKSQCINIDLWLPDLQVTSSIEVNITGTNINCPSQHLVVHPIDVTTGTGKEGLRRECSHVTMSVNSGGVTSCEYLCICSADTCLSLHILVKREAITGISGRLLDVVYYVL